MNYILKRKTRSSDNPFLLQLIIWQLIYSNFKSIDPDFQIFKSIKTVNKNKSAFNASFVTCKHYNFLMIQIPLKVWLSAMNEILCVNDKYSIKGS